MVLTGAGISAESGVPTFREAQEGLWAKYSPEELASPKAFQQHPEIVLRWYQWRISLISQARPNPAHQALVQLEDLCIREGKRFLLITQNVDNLHQAAGSQQIVELHGNIFRTRCHHCGTRQERNLAAVDLEEGIPHCQQCQGLLRPDVVWFGETLPAAALNTAWEQSANSDFYLVVGTSAAVEPAASFPILALENGGTVLEINPNSSNLSPRISYRLPHPAGAALPALVQALQQG